METKKLFYEDGYMKTFTAVVTAVEEKKDEYYIILDQTAFFPEGGGQAGDKGWLDDVEVLDTQEKGDIIYHVTKEPLEVGKTVTGKLEFEERFMKMQQHSGEHIISGIVHNLYGYDNVGFHLGTEATTLDFNGELSKEQVREVELLTNQAVFANLPITALYPSKEELGQMDYRSKIEIEGQVRIISIPEIDLCACCAPHVKQTGEIGLVKILSCERHRGGCRVTMAAGSRALLDYQEKQQRVTEVSVALSARPDKIGEAVLHLKEQHQQLREQLNKIQAVYLQEKLHAVTPEQKVVILFEEELDQMAVRNFVNQAMDLCDGICAAFVGNDVDGYRYIIGSRKMDVRPLAKQLNEAFSGRGGGKPEMVQGSLKGTKREIAEMVAEAVL